MGKKLALFLIILLALAYFIYRGVYAQEEPIVREDEYGLTRIYEGEMIYKFRREEAKRIKAVAEEFAEALIAKDQSKLMDMSHYEGFASKKSEKVAELIDKYHDGEEVELKDIKIKSVKTDDRVEIARVLGFLTSIRKVDNRDVEQAPALEKWTFIYKYGKWRLLLEED